MLLSLIPKTYRKLSNNRGTGIKVRLMVFIGFRVHRVHRVFVGLGLASHVLRVLAGFTASIISLAAMLV